MSDLDDLVSYLNDQRSIEDSDMPWDKGDVTLDAEQLETVMQEFPHEFAGASPQVGAQAYQTAAEILVPRLEEERERRLEEEAEETDQQIFERECG